MSEPHSAGPRRIVKPAGIADAGYRYVPGYLSETEADDLFDRLLRETHWQSEQLVLFGRRRPVPRLVAWYGDRGLSYRYSGSDHVAEGWPDSLLVLRQRVTAEIGQRPDFLLMNRYRTGQDAMGWHTDDEVCRPEDGDPLWIASLSLGATRRFRLRPLGGDSSMPLDLEHGSLLMMNPRVPHSLPKTRRPVGERLNLSFRVIS